MKTLILFISTSYEIVQYSDQLQKQPYFNVKLKSM